MISPERAGRTPESPPPLAGVVWSPGAESNGASCPTQEVARDKAVEVRAGLAGFHPAATLQGLDTNEGP